MTKIPHDFDESGLTDRYLADELSVEDNRVLQEKFSQNPTLKEDLDHLRLLVSHPGRPPATYNASSRIQEIVSASESVSRKSNSALWVSRSSFWRNAMIAVAVTLVVVASMIIDPLAFRAADKSSVTLITTGKGERSTVKLPDGTTVTLNVESQLNIPVDFQSSRIINLDGEAFFHVTLSSNQPFQVRTGDITTTVLGTEFAVRSYSAEEVRVSVQSGKVSVAGVVLDANSMANIYGQDSVTVLRNANIAQQLSFVSGNLSIDYTPLRQASADLSRWYNIDIVFADSAVAELLFSADLPIGSVTDLVEILNLTLPVKTTLSGRVLTIASSPRGNTQ